MQTVILSILDDESIGTLRILMMVIKINFRQTSDPIHWHIWVLFIHPQNYLLMAFIHTQYRSYTPNEKSEMVSGLKGFTLISGDEYYELTSPQTQEHKS